MQKKTILGMVLIYVILLQSSIPVLGSSSSVVLAKDDKEDMKKVTNSWLEKKIGDDVEDWDDLNKAFDKIYDNFDDEDIFTDLSDKEYDKYGIGDIREAGVKELDEDNATIG